jgi:thiosulfate sulfurtransferase
MRIFLMSQFKHISTAATFERLQQSTPVVICDIRDEQSYQAAHIAGSFHLTNGTLAQFMQQHNEDTTVIVVCYHGNSSRGAAQYLCEQGFEDVYSMDGGFEAWRGVYPAVSGTE